MNDKLFQVSPGKQAWRGLLGWLPQHHPGNPIPEPPAKMMPRALPASEGSGGEWGGNRKKQFFQAPMLLLQGGGEAGWQEGKAGACSGLD